MIERFNFYDLYGYLIPGGIFIAVLMLPYGLTTWHAPGPDIKLESIAVVLVVAYILGHFIQGMASGAIPAKLARDKNGTRGFPSDLMLNPSNRALSSNLKQRIKNLVDKRFNIDLDISSELDLKQPADQKIAAARRNAFFLCRPIANKASAYAEQFQGMYVMMRGLFLASLLGCASYLGWLLWFAHSVQLSKAMQWLLALALIVSLLLAIWRAFDTKSLYHRLDAAGLYALAVALFASGELLAGVVQPPPDRALPLAAITLFLPVAGFRFFAAYRYFADEFAKAVWTYFAAVELDEKTDAPKT